MAISSVLCQSATKLHAGTPKVNFLQFLTGLAILMYMNVTFIGMSGAGKSYLGQQFADRFQMQFFDIDREMEAAYGKPLQVILDEIGEARFLKEQSLQVTNMGVFDRTVVSPGGSIVYTEEAVQYLKANSVVIYLEVPLSVILSRTDTTVRGIVGLGHKTFAQLYTERAVLYRAAADYTIDPTNHDVDDLLESIYAACMLR